MHRTKQKRSSKGGNSSSSRGRTVGREGDRTIGREGDSMASTVAAPRAKTGKGGTDGERESRNSSSSKGRD